MMATMKLRVMIMIGNAALARSAAARRAQMIRAGMAEE